MSEREAIIETMARANYEEDNGLAWPPVTTPIAAAYRADALIALAALESAGYVIVKREPDEAMIAAYWDSIEREHDALTMKGKAAARYRAMIAAQEQK